MLDDEPTEPEASNFGVATPVECVSEFALVGGLMTDTKAMTRKGTP